MRRDFMYNQQSNDQIVEVYRVIDDYQNQTFEYVTLANTEEAISVETKPAILIDFRTVSGHLWYYYPQNSNVPFFAKKCSASDCKACS
jgi:hypothetical protein